MNIDTLEQIIAQQIQDEVDRDIMSILTNEVEIGNLVKTGMTREEAVEYILTRNMKTNEEIMMDFHSTTDQNK